MSARQIRVALRFSNGQRVEGMTTPGATIWETLQALCKQVSPNPNQPTADGGFSPMLAQTIERKTSGILLKTDERPQGDREWLKPVVSFGTRTISETSELQSTYMRDVAKGDSVLMNVAFVPSGTSLSVAQEKITKVETQRQASFEKARLLRAPSGTPIAGSSSPVTPGNSSPLPMNDGNGSYGTPSSPVPSPAPPLAPLRPFRYSVQLARAALGHLLTECVANCQASGENPVDAYQKALDTLSKILTNIASTSTQDATDTSTFTSQSPAYLAESYPTAYIKSDPKITRIRVLKVGLDAYLYPMYPIDTPPNTSGSSSSSNDGDVKSNANPKYANKALLAAVGRWEGALATLCSAGFGWVDEDALAACGTTAIRAGISTPTTSTLDDLSVEKGYFPPLASMVYVWGRNGHVDTNTHYLFAGDQSASLSMSDDLTDPSTSNVTQRQKELTSYLTTSTSSSSSSSSSSAATKMDKTRRSGLYRLCMHPRHEDASLIRAILGEVSEALDHAVETATQYIQRKDKEREIEAEKELERRKHEGKMGDEVTSTMPIDTPARNSNSNVSSSMSSESAGSSTPPSQASSALTTTTTSSSSSSSSTFASQDDYDIGDLKNGLDCLRTECEGAPDEDVFTRKLYIQALQSLLAIANNVLNKILSPSASTSSSSSSPSSTSLNEERKDIRIDTSKPAFASRLGRFSGTMIVLQFIGFKIVTSPNESSSSSSSSGNVEGRYLEMVPTHADTQRVSRAATLLQRYITIYSPSTDAIAYSNALTEGRVPLPGSTTASRELAVYDGSDRRDARHPRLQHAAVTTREDDPSDVFLVASVMADQRMDKHLVKDNRFLTKAEVEANAAKKKREYSTTIIRVEFPGDQVLLQGKFLPSEPYTNLFDWIDSCLSTTSSSTQAMAYDLILSPMQAVTRDRGLVDPNKSLQNYQLLQGYSRPGAANGEVKESAGNTFTSLRALGLVPAANLRIQLRTSSGASAQTATLSSLFSTVNASGQDMLRSDLLRLKKPFEHVAVPQSVNHQQQQQQQQQQQRQGGDGAAKEGKSHMSEIDDEELERMASNLLGRPGGAVATTGGSSGSSGGTGGAKPGPSKVPAWMKKR